MQWWHDVALREHLDDLLAHCNHAMDIKNRPLVTNICSLYYHALNKFWTGHNQQNGELKRGDISSFAAILQAMPEESKVIFLAAEAVRSLVALDPAVINLSEKHDATKVHRKLKNSFRDLDAHSPGASVDGTLKKFAELLYVIRCNFMHGEKTPYGPNLHKSQRDGEVSKLTVPVQMIILDLLLDRPGEKLVAYGTKARGSRAW